MEIILNYRIPVGHPIIIHFPVVLLLVALVATAVWMVRDRPAPLAFATWLAAASVIAAQAARMSGLVMRDQSAGTPIVEALLPVHEQGALWTLILSAGLLAGLIIARLAGERQKGHPGVRRPVRFLVFLLALAAGAAVLWTAHVGGVMVWGVPT